MYIYRRFLTALSDINDNRRFVDTLEFNSHNNRYETIYFKGTDNKRFKSLSEGNNNKRINFKSFRLLDNNNDMSRRIASMQAYNKNYKISSFKK